MAYKLARSRTRAQAAVYEWRAFAHATLTEMHAGAVRLLHEAERQGSPVSAGVNVRGLQEFAASVGDALVDLARCGIEPPTEVEVPDPLSGLAS